MASLHPRPNADGSTSWRLHYRLDGKPKTLTFFDEAMGRHWTRTFDELGVPKALALLDAARGMAPPAPAGPTVRMVVEEHIGKLSGIQAGTIESYRREATRDIYPHLGDVPVAQLGGPHGPDIIGGWVQTLHDQPLSAKTIQNRHGLLSAALKRAVRLGVLTVNPCESTTLPDGNPEEPMFLTREQWWELHDAMRAHWRPLITVLAGTGLRWGEATALRVRDVDLDRKRLHVAQAWKFHPANGKRTIGAPKSAAGRRHVPILDPALEALGPLMEGRGPDALVLVNTAGTRVRYSTFHGGPWTTCLDDLGWPRRPRIHDLRHSYVSWLLASSQVSIFTLARILGHGDVKVTDRRYGHLLRRPWMRWSRLGTRRCAAPDRRAQPRRELQGLRHRHPVLGSEDLPRPLRGDQRCEADDQVFPRARARPFGTVQFCSFHIHVPPVSSPAGY